LSEHASEVVLVVDDDAAFRALAAEVLGSVGYTTVQLDSGSEVAAAVEEHQPALVLLDVQLPGRNGYEVCRELRDAHGNAFPIVFVSGERVESLDRSAGFLVGGDEYLVKPVDPGELIARVRRLLEWPRANGNGARETRLETLTPREREILGLLTEGYGQDEIAQKLVISPKTVATHIQRVLGKLQVGTRAQAVALALRSERSDVIGHVFVC
jgi:DNA-binding NarL/FixJ family response regulator